jgi:hypothetical protein
VTGRAMLHRKRLGRGGAGVDGARETRRASPARGGRGRWRHLTVRSATARVGGGAMAAGEGGGSAVDDLRE